MVILTTPHTFLIDKVARRLAHFQIEMTEKRYSESISIGKLLEVKDQYRNTGKTHYHFPIVDDVKYKRIIFKRASQDIADAYEAKRKEIRQTMMQESIESIKQSEDGSTQAKPEKTPKHIQIAADVLKKINENPKITTVRLADELSTSKDTIVKTKKYLTSIGRL